MVFSQFWGQLKSLEEKFDHVLCRPHAVAPEGQRPIKNPVTAEPFLETEHVQNTSSVNSVAQSTQLQQTAILEAQVRCCLVQANKTLALKFALALLQLIDRCLFILSQREQDILQLHKQDFQMIATPLCGELLSKSGQQYCFWARSYAARSWNENRLLRKIAVMLTWFSNVGSLWESASFCPADWHVEC